MYRLVKSAGLPWWPTPCPRISTMTWARYRVVEYDNWFKESSLSRERRCGPVVELLKEKGATYEKAGAAWLRGSTAARTSCWCEGTGAHYVVPDIAYHYGKLVTRGFDLAIDVLGADHHGYVCPG